VQNAVSVQEPTRRHPDLTPLTPSLSAVPGSFRFFFLPGVQPNPGKTTNFGVSTVFAARSTDLQSGKMQIVEISGKKILLLRTTEDQWHALSPTCPHAGAPLEKGALCGTRLICPWHKSCFAADDGSLQEPPSLESLQSYFVEVAGDEVRVDLERSITKKEAYHDQLNARSDQTFVVLGAGAAGAAAVQELRSLGFAGRLVMISEEQRNPYDRTQLSKMYLSGNAGPKDLPLHPETMLRDCRVEFLVAEVDRLDARNRLISFKQKVASLSYDKILVATGGKPKLFPIPGWQPQPLVLRNVEDANRIIEAAEKAKSVVLIGSSFISMEAASAFRERGLEVTVISQESMPLAKHLGLQMSQLLLDKHLEKGVCFLPETKILSISRIGSGSLLKLSTGRELVADLVVNGTGILPATAFLENVRHNEGLSVDAFMKVSGAEHMFAAGDVADFPLPGSGRRARIEHWRVAQEQARIAAANMMGMDQPYQGLPYFWTYHYGVRYEFFGQLPDQCELLIDGDVQQSRFVAAYLSQGRCEAIFAANRESDTARLFDYMERQGPPSFQSFQAILALG
jgi:apoptosis-inducing factor 3